MPRPIGRFARRRVVTTTGAATPSQPTFTSNPAILGSAVVGATLTAVDGTAIGNPSPTITRVWLRDGLAISGATGTTYVLVEADLGTTITVRNTATNGVGTPPTATSTGVGPVLEAGSGTLEPFDVTFTNTHSSAQLAAGPQVFGHVFAKGEVAANEGLQATINGVVQEPQVDWLTTYSDGSLKQASIVVERPLLSANTAVTCRVALGTPSAASEVNVTTLLTGRSITLDLTSMTTYAAADKAVTTNPANTTLDIKAAILAAIASPSSDPNQPTYWLRGHKCTQVRTIFMDGNLADTSMRVIVDATLFANGDIKVELAGFNDRLNESSQTGKGRLDATWNLKIDTVSRYTATLKQIHGSAWRKEIWDKDAPTARWPAAQNPDGSLATLLVSIPVSRWARSKAIAPMDTKVTPHSDIKTGYLTTQGNANWMKPLWHNGLGGLPLTASSGDRTMGTAGGGDWSFMDMLGQPVNAWLLGPDIVYQREALAWADGIFASQYHVWDTNRNHWLDRSFHPKMTANDDTKTLPPNPDTATAECPTTRNNTVELSGLVTANNHYLPFGEDEGGYLISYDIPHAPRTTYFPYLATGCRFWYDQMQAQAAWAVTRKNYWDHGHNLEYPNNYEMFFYTDPRTMSGEVEGWQEVRGMGWGWAIVDNARFVARSGSHADTYMTAVGFRQLDGLQKQRANMLTFYGSGGDAVQGYPFARVIGNGYDKRKRIGMYHFGYYMQAIIYSVLRREDTDATRAWALNFLELSGRFYEGFFENTGGYDWKQILQSVHMVRRYADDSFTGPVKTWSGRWQILENWVADWTADGATGSTQYDPRWDFTPNEWHGTTDYFEPHAAATTGVLALLYRCWRDHFGDATKAAKYLGYYQQIMALDKNVGYNGLSLQAEAGYRRRMRYIHTLWDEGENPAFNEHQSKGQIGVVPTNVPVLSAPGGSIAAVPEGTPVGTPVCVFSALNPGFADLGVFAPTITAQGVANAFKLRHDLTLVTDTGFSAVSFATHGGAGISVTARVANDLGNSNTVTITVPITDNKPVTAAATFSLAEHAPANGSTLTVGQQIGTINIVSPAALTAVEIQTQSPAGAMDLGTVTGSVPNFSVPIRVLDPTKFDYEGTNPATASVRAQNANGWGAAATQTVNISNIMEAGEASTPTEIVASGDRVLWVDGRADGDITTAGGSVSSWANKWGASLNLAQATAGAQPTHNTTTDAVTFDNSDDILVSANSYEADINHLEFVVVGVWSSAGNAGFWSVGHDFTGAGAIRWGNDIEFEWGSSGMPRIAASGALSDSTPHVIAFVHSTARGVREVWVDGTKVANDTSVWGWGTIVPSLGFYKNLPGNGACKTCVMTKDASAATVDKLTGWAAHAFGLAGNLPSGHPYKSTAP